MEAQLKLKRAYKVLQENSRLKKEFRDLMQARAGRLERTGSGATKADLAEQSGIWKVYAS